MEINLDQERVGSTSNNLKLMHGLNRSHGIQKTKPTVSVGLPVYNGGNLLQQAIESILSQDFSDFELIISDNCSTDQTEEVCRLYQRKDRRIRYYRMDENLGSLHNFKQVVNLAVAPFFMWATHDDLREKSFISNCLTPFDEDSAVALVYTHTRVLDADSNLKGFHKDPFLVNQECPKERFRNLIWGLGLCNAAFGIFRRPILKKAMIGDRQTLFGDTLQLASIALLGKFVQIEKPLFIRRLTRNYDYRSYDERNTQLMSETDPTLFRDGITFPHSRLAYAHLEVVNQSSLSEFDKEQLMQEIRRCFRTRYGPRMTYEIDRAIALINKGIFYYQWDQSCGVNLRNEGGYTMNHFHISGLLQRLQEALFFFPEREDLINAYHKCQDIVVRKYPAK